MTLSPLKHDDPIFTKYGQLHGIDPLYLAAIAMTESSLRPWVTGDNGNSLGLMQVSKEVWQRWGGGLTEDPFDPDLNLKAASAYLAHLLTQFSLEDATMAYNEGDGNVKKGIKDQKYLNKVLGYFEQFKKEEKS